MNFLLGTNSGGKTAITLTTDAGSNLTYYEYGTDVPLSALMYNSTTGTGYNTLTNTTTVLVHSPLALGKRRLQAHLPQRLGAPGGPTVSTGAGVTNLSIMSPNLSDGSEDYPTGTVFATPYLQLMSNYSVIRLNTSSWDLDQADANAETDWTYRPTPAPFDFVANVNAAHDAEQNVAPWEEEVLLSNETGKDLYVNLPGTASGESPTDTSSYIYQLAEMLKNGDTVDGVVYPGLLPNLNIYIEYDNEIWNYSGPNAGVTPDFLEGRTTNSTDYQNFIASGGWISTQENVNLASSYNQTGIYASGTTFSTTAGLFGTGDAFLASQFDASSWGNVQIGSAGSNDVVTAAGQTISIASGSQGEYSTLTIYATGNGNQTSQSFLIHYANGSTQTYTTTVGGWLTSGNSNTFATYSSYATSSGTTAAGSNYIYAYTVTLSTSTSDVTAVTLPSSGNKVAVAGMLLTGPPCREPGLIPRAW